LNPGPITFVSLATAPRTVTFPDNTGTVAELNVNSPQTFTGANVFSAPFPSAIFNRGVSLCNDLTAPCQVEFDELGPPGAYATSAAYVYADVTTQQLMLNNHGHGYFPFTQTIFTGTSTMGTTIINAGACEATVTTAAAGVATTDTITWSYASFAAPTTDGVLILNAFPTSGHVNFSVCNPTAGNITPTGLVVNWRVIR